MSFTALGQRIWPVTPDWSAGVQETLAWISDVLRANATAATQHRALASDPRRTLTFEVLTAGQERRATEMLLAGHRGAWQLPIWPDQQWLHNPEPAGAEEIECLTAGYDFVEGGRALIYHALNDWEVVEIDTIEPGGLVLVDPTVSPLGMGARLFPLRRAHVQDGAEELLGNANTGRRGITFDIDEPCAWPELASPITYLGHLVLETPPDESEDPASSFERLRQVVDLGPAQPFRHDLAGVALRMQQTRWKLYGRAEHTWLRSLVYTLCGRHRPIWIPSFSADLQPAASVTGGSTSLSVEWAGYTLFGLGRPNRRDIRIRLDDGTLLYRRITNAVDAGATETLTLSAALDGEAIARERIRGISIMSLCTLASDEVEIEHHTDAAGVAEVALGWSGVVPDV